MPQSPDAPRSQIASYIPELDRLAADVMADWRVPGAALAVVQDDKVVLARAYGQRDVEADLPVTPATQFAICSITKSFTATAIALLHDEGRLDWAKPVRDFIPEFRLNDPVATERVTVLDLLCHRTGLPRHDWVHEPGDLAPADMLGLMRHLELSRDIRSAFQYNNLCYNVAGLLIERLSGQSYQAFIRARLTDQLGMNVGFNIDDLEASSEPARPYKMYEDTRLPAFRLPITTTASGAMTTSVVDFANWMRLHLGQGAFDGERILPAALIGELHAPRVYNTLPGYAEFGPAHYGLGFQCNSYRGDRLVEHGGGWIGWNTQMTLLPDFGIGIAVFTNRSPNQVPWTLTLHVIDRLRGREPIEWRERFRKRRDEFLAHLQLDKDARAKARHNDTRPAHGLAAYAGDYAHPAYGVMSIKEQDGALHWSWRGLFATLVHRHFETFETPEVLDRYVPDSLPITFLTNRDGNIVSLSAPLEPAVADIVFVRLAAGDCTDAAFRARCVGSFKWGAITHRVALDREGALELKSDHQPVYRLAPEQGRRFRIVGLASLVEFCGDGTTVDEMIFHHPGGTFVARRTDE
ncbi:serine hydrolase [Bradyrhizobium sp. LTSPM299]|uniref:serine hydrolase n=1 Tax=Bradyrhizobium sp. LTSPM299 TaxID=1619233 RepID=UPI0005CB4937|nr:serine hydrolase [Bradyrhizobium sp. LTSPM299]